MFVEDHILCICFEAIDLSFNFGKATGCKSRKLVNCSLESLLKMDGIFNAFWFLVEMQ